MTYTSSSIWNTLANTSAKKGKCIQSPPESLVSTNLEIVGSWNIIVKFNRTIWHPPVCEVLKQMVARQNHSLYRNWNILWRATLTETDINSMVHLVCLQLHIWMNFNKKLGSELENPPLRTGERFLCIQNRSHVADDRNTSSLLKKSTTFNLRLHSGLKWGVRWGVSQIWPKTQF